MNTNYWIKDETRQEIITKTLIPNKGNFKFFGTYFNLMDKKGLSLQMNENSEFETDKLFTKNGFHYLALQLGDLKEFLVLPNENLETLTEKIVSKINDCDNEYEIINLVISQMD